MQDSGSKVLRVKDWAKFQHYRDRKPPWIKLATDVFQNTEFQSLNTQSKLLMICIWTLASRTQDGTIPDDFPYIRTWGFLGADVTKRHLDNLIRAGLLIRRQDASNMLASCKQVARAEGEGEGETEGEADCEIPKIVISMSELHNKRESSAVAQFLLNSLDWTGTEAVTTYSDILYREHKNTAKDHKVIAEEMIFSWQLYESEPRQFKRSISKFFKEGLWKRPDDWKGQDATQGKQSNTARALQALYGDRGGPTVPPSVSVVPGLGESSGEAAGDGESHLKVRRAAPNRSS